ncbi:hypothetical protein Tco_0304021 [Tanacetum coccineum]
MTVTTSIIELEGLFGPFFDEYFNGENQVVSKSSDVTTANASDKRQQQQDSTSSTSTLATTITADGNFDLSSKSNKIGEIVSLMKERRLGAFKINLHAHTFLDHDITSQSCGSCVVGLSVVMMSLIRNIKYECGVVNWLYWNEVSPSPSLLDLEIKQLTIKLVGEDGFVIRPSLVRVTSESVRTDL